MIQWYQAKPIEIPDGKTYKAGIVLGGFVSYNMKDDKGYFNPACDRFIQTALLYKTGKIENIIVAAGNGYIVKHDFKEAEFIKQHLVELGIPPQSIFIDPNSRNTLENAINSRRIIDSVHLNGPFLLISSALHIPRAVKVFTKKDVSVIAFPCDFMSENVGNNILEDFILPSANSLRNWDAFLKEIVGVISYKITGNG